MYISEKDYEKMSFEEVLSVIEKVSKTGEAIYKVRFTYDKDKQILQMYAYDEKLNRFIMPEDSTFTDFNESTYLLPKNNVRKLLVSIEEADQYFDDIRYKPEEDEMQTYIF